MQNLYHTFFPKTFLNSFRQKTAAFITKKPWLSFFIVLILLFGVMFLGHTFRTPTPEAEKASLPAKEVALFSQDSTPTITVPAQIKKDAVISVPALTSGIVSNIFVRTGQSVTQGQILFTLTNDYGSGSAAIEKEIARNDASLAEEVSSLDKKIQSLDERRIKRDDTLSGSAEDVELARLKKDREVRRYTLTNSRLNLALALRNDAVLQPKSSLSGTVNQISVRRGQFVNAGETLATLSGTGTDSTVEALLSSDTAWLIDPSKNAELILTSGEAIELTLIHLSTQENENGFYTALFSLPKEAAMHLTNDSYVNIRIALQSGQTTILLPLETISQDTESAWVMIEENGFAKVQTVTLGNILGNYIEVTSGLDTQSRVILSRGVIEGEAITSK